MLLSQAESRLPDLVPIRHGRMLVSPFTYYRGAALPMAADLATTPTSGLRVQLCGDAHLSNFGAFASPERKLVFDLNDFDETLPGPFEWDVKRLAASVVVAGRDNEFSRKDIRKAVLAAVSGYRLAMRGFAKQPLMDVWYAYLDIEETLKTFTSQLKPKSVKNTEAMLAKARTRDSMQALNKLTTHCRRAAPHHQQPTHRRPGGRALQRHEGRRDLRRALGLDVEVRPHAAVRPTPLAGAVHPDPGGPQGRGGGQCRDSSLDPAPGRRRRHRAVVPPGQGGAALGARRLRRAQQDRQPGPTCRGGPAPDAGQQ